MNKFPLRNQGKPIFDPFKSEASDGQMVRIGIKMVDQTDRKTYEVHRACGHCRGTGKRRDDHSPGIAQEAAKCSQCLLGKHYRGKVATDKGHVELWGRKIERFAHELTEAELKHLEPNKRLGAHFELNQHDENRRIARILSDEEHEARKPVVVSRVRNFA
jgi:hypothetical protein